MADCWGGCVGVPQITLPLALVVDSVFWVILFPATIRYHIEKDQLTLVSVCTLPSYDDAFNSNQTRGFTTADVNMNVTKRVWFLTFWSAEAF